MKKVYAHITVEGAPLCTHPNHLGLYGVTSCGYLSLASARRAKLKLQEKLHSVRVVRGRCPAP